MEADSSSNQPVKVKKPFYLNPILYHGLLIISAVAVLVSFLAFSNKNTSFTSTITAPFKSLIAGFKGYLASNAQANASPSPTSTLGQELNQKGVRTDQNGQSLNYDQIYNSALQGNEDVEQHVSKQTEEKKQEEAKPQIKLEFQKGQEQKVGSVNPSNPTESKSSDSLHLEGSYR